MNSREQFHNIQTILFDMDGVVTSEEEYWLAAELTVLELLYSKQFVGLENDVLRTVLFKPGRAVSVDKFVSPKFIGMLKSNGVNSNWDLCFFSVAIYLVELLFTARDSGILKRVADQGFCEETLRALGEALPNRRKYLEHINHASAFFHQFYKKWRQGSEAADVSDPSARSALFERGVNQWLAERTGIEAPLFARGNDFWELCRILFQERFLGDTLFDQEESGRRSQMFKDGLINYEMPIIPLNRIIDALGLLKDAGLTLGVATGRPYREIMIPLEKWGLLHFFDRERIATHREMKLAEQALASQSASSLAKPHPFIYLRSLYPEKSDAEILEISLPLAQGDKVLVVGDSAADLLAAKAMGCPCAVVMTGVSDLEAAHYLKSLDPEFVLEDVSSIKDLF
jgi:phosphoglycolate phosphatase-like HAD superfamily hydrolase